MIGFSVAYTDDSQSVLAAEAKATGRALAKAAFEISKAAKESIETSSVASSPGKPPHTRRGQMRRAIRYSVEKKEGVAVIGPVASMVGTSAEPEEFGGMYRGQNYPKRPFMGPALEKKKSLLPAFWTAEVHN